MSHYSSTTNMTQRFREDELIDLTNKATGASTGAIVTSVLNEALHDAESLMDSYFDTAGYVTPLVVTTVPEVVTRIACDIARWFLHTRAGVEVQNTEPRLRYEDALKWLQKVADGDLSIHGAAFEDDAVGGGVAASTRTQVFDDETVSKMSDFGY